MRLDILPCPLPCLKWGEKNPSALAATRPTHPLSRDFSYGTGTHGRLPPLSSLVMSHFFSSKNEYRLG